ncbi:sigma-E processing peptidase SpoIIGA [Bacillus taeanensis]|uniref:Sporulation sigma-E factor-processing peptidase n=1 Tax=Bacillus taeanensis TaxID=273032 RepID=A0A366XT84_9BACI|nr:sigma-E processing peptidase SpoIIGA [Bacillus taeanensis]RBW67364.1 sigma-E processing peptidase SpoIIGA [Bacillus taeanensis]
MTIYLDVIWFLNFCTDFLLLSLTGIFLKRDLKKLRLLTGTLIASCYVIAIVSPLSYLFYHPLFKLIFSMFLMIIVFGYKKFSYFMQNLCMFYFVTFMIGGGMLAVHYFLQSDWEVMRSLAAAKSTGYGDPISWSFVIFGFPSLWYFSKHRVEHLEIRKVHYDQIADVTIQIEESIFTVKGLIDSGNQLADPITKTPVMILDINHCQLPEALHKKLKEVALIFQMEEKHSWQERVRIVPYRGVGQVQEFLTAIKPDLVTISQGNTKYETNKCLIGLSENMLSSEDDFQCILHPKMLLQSSNHHAS